MRTVVLLGLLGSLLALLTLSVGGGLLSIAGLLAALFAAFLLLLASLLDGQNSDGGGD